MRMIVEYLDGTKDKSVDTEESWEDIENFLVEFQGFFFKFETDKGPVIAAISAIKRITPQK